MWSCTFGFPLGTGDGPSNSAAAQTAVYSTSHAGLTAEDTKLAADKLGTQQQLNVDSIKWALMGLSLISRSSVVLIAFSLQIGAQGSCDCQLFTFL